MGVPYLKPNETQKMDPKRKSGILDPQKFTHDKNAIFVNLHQLFNQSILALQNLQPEMTQTKPEMSTKPSQTKPEMTTMEPEMTTKTNPISTEKLSTEDIGLIMAIIIVIIVIIIVIVPIFVTKYAQKPKNLPYQAFQDEEDLNFPRITPNPEYFQLNSEEPRTLIMAPKFIVNDQESAVLL